MKIPTSLSRAVASRGLTLERNAPSYLFVGGVVGVIGSTVLACRSTLQLETTIKATERELDMAKHVKEQDEKHDPVEHKKIVAMIYARGVGDVAKLYAPSIVLGTVSIGMLTKSHNMLQARNEALMAAYMAVDQAFTRYRERVIEKYGEEQDQQFRYETETVEVTGDNGRKKKVVRVAPGESSMYARFFDERSPSWSKDPEINLLFLRCQQDYANDLLKARGHVFLNEVYDSLGMERSQAGSVVGWMMALHGDGDNFIDFNVFSGESQAARDFVNGHEGSILLDFNVDGVIFDKIDTPREAVSWQRGN